MALGTGNGGVGLLEALHAQIGCMYLSDLPKPELFPLIQQELWKCIPEQFSLREWCDAVHYLTGERRTFADQQTAADFLRNYEASS